MSVLTMIFGLSLFAAGVYGIFLNWWLLTDFAGVIIPLCLVLFGCISVAAGVGTIKDNRRQRR